MAPKFKHTKDEIIDTGFRIVRHHGWSAFSARAIADELGSSSRPIYSFFSSTEQLEEEIVKRAVILLHEHMTRQRTGEPWMDHGIGYVIFAYEEKHLFRGLNDEKHIPYFKKYGDNVWNTVTDALSGYAPFRGLSAEQIKQIQVTRWLFAHGLAFQVSNPTLEIWDEAKIVEMMLTGSRAIYDGLMKTFVQNHINSQPREALMAEIDPRKMALQIAGLRANETHLPENERVFQDPYAEYFFPDDIRALFQDPCRVKAELQKYEQMMPGVNGAIVARIKFIDECLKDLVAKGLEQAVVIGAGYDTRSYRIPGVKENLRVFEVDHPDTQAVKTETIKRIFGNLPEHVTYVPIVFGKDPLAEKLMTSGYNKDLKTLFIIEGVLMYLPPPAVENLLTFIAASSGPESAIVADYFDTTVVQGRSPLKEAIVLRQFVESEGSSLKFGVPAGEDEAFFRRFGFRRVDCVSAPACKDKFFTNDSRNRTVSKMFNFVYAVK